MLPLAMAMQPEQLHDHDSPHNHANRWKMTPENKLRLQQAFDEMPYPSRETKTQLANELGVRREQVAKWFQHRREALSKLGQFQGQAMRARRTEEERQILQAAYDRNPYPNAQELAAISQTLQNVTEKQIKLWFKHRRKQMKKKGQLPPRRRGSRLSVPLPPPEPIPEPVVEFTRDEIMQMRGALAASGMEPSPDVLERLAQMMNRPLSAVQNWFIAERDSQSNYQFTPEMATLLQQRMVGGDPNIQTRKDRKVEDQMDPNPVSSLPLQQPYAAHFAPQYRMGAPMSFHQPGTTVAPPPMKCTSMDGQATSFPSTQREFPQFMMVASSTDQTSYPETTSAAQPGVDSTLMVDPSSYNRSGMPGAYNMQPKPWLVSPGLTSLPQTSLPDTTGTSLNPTWPTTTGTGQ